MTSVTWDEFERRLAAALERMATDTFLVVTQPSAEGGTGYYVQFARLAGGEGVEPGLRAEAVGNEHLPAVTALTTGQVRRLGRLGWKRPTSTDRARNFTRSWPVPLPYGEVARMAVVTLRDVYGIAEPARLRYVYRSFGRGDVGALDLGIDPAPAARTPARSQRRRAGRAAEELRPIVERALKRWLRQDELVRDADGDYPVRLGSALMYVRLADGVPPVVRIFSLVLREVPESPALLEALNQANARIRFGRTFWAGGSVYIACDLVAAGITADQVAVACTELANLADHLDDGFHGRFGGGLMFEAPTGRVN